MPILGIYASSQFIQTGSYESIATTTVGSGGSATITFSSIPSTYKHLQLRTITRDENTVVGSYFLGRFNSDATAANYYALHVLTGDGSSASSSAASNIVNGYSYFGRTAGGSSGGASANVFATTIVDILDYSNTNKNKTVRSLLGVDNNGSGLVSFSSSLWMSTSAINNISIRAATGSFQQYSSFALYGIK